MGLQQQKTFKGTLGVGYGPETAEGSKNLGVEVVIADKKWGTNAACERAAYSKKWG